MMTVMGSPLDAWDLDPAVVHLNHGSFGAVPRPTLEQQARLKSEMESNPVAWFSALAPRVAIAREQVAAFLGTDPQRTALVENASAGASVVFNSIDLDPDVEVVVTSHGYGAFSMGAHRFARRQGARFRTLDIPLEATAEAVIDLVRVQMPVPGSLLVIDQITSATARAFPVGQICAMAREHGVISLVDGAHAVALMDQPVQQADADYWVGNLHKFACGARGTAALVARGGGQALWPLIDSWGATLEFPWRFDHVGTTDLTSWLATPTSLEFLKQEFGWARIRHVSAELAEAGQRVIAASVERHTGLPALPDVGQPVGPMRLVRLPTGLGRTREEADALRIPFIQQAGIATSFTSFAGQGYTRISAHIYNTLDDYQRFADIGVPLLVQWAQQTTPV